MQYISTRNSSLRKSFSEVLLGGLAPDGGLYMPLQTFRFSIDQIENLNSLTYQEITTEILHQFVSDEINKKDFENIVNNAYQVFDSKDVVNLVKLEDQRWILELFHGPTLAFKDVAMQLLGTLLDHFAQKKEIKIAVLGATSGDTGSAAISACSRYKNVEVFILYPHERITEVQRKQMTTTQATNVHALSVQTDFDGCQAMVKQLFLDESILSNQTRFVAANSINWARCMTQSVYYFWTYLRLKEELNQMTFSIPSGNFGHAYAGWLAKEMGLPINKIFIATNSNDVLHKLFSENSYKKGKVSQTLAPSMDIAVASNFERLLFNLYKNNAEMLQTAMSSFPQNEISLPLESWKEVEDFFLSFPSSDQEILEEIKSTYEQHNYVLDPHTATGVRAAKELAQPNQSVISMATAHPAKFMEAIQQSLGEEAVEIPAQLQAIADKEEDFVILPDNIDKVREYILSSLE
jgi:threonine synthase